MGMSTAIIVVGALTLSSVSADTEVSGDEGTSVSTESSTTSVASEPMLTNGVAPTMSGSINYKDNLFMQCLADAKLKGLIGVDCKAKTEDFKKLLKSYQTERETLMKDTILTPEEKAIKMKEIVATHMTALSPYITTNMQNASKAMMKERTALMTKKQALSDKLHGQLTILVKELSVEKLTKILTNIEKVVIKVNNSSMIQSKKDNFLAQLEEIRTIIQKKIDAMTGVSSEINIIDEVLSDIVTGPSGETNTGELIYDDANTIPMNNTISGTTTNTINGTTTP